MTGRVVIGVVALGVVVCGVLLLRDVRATEAALNTVDARLGEVLQAADDPERAALAADDAVSAARSAVTRSDGPLWAALRPLPWIGDQVDAVQSLSATALAAAELAQVGVEVAGPLLGGDLPVPLEDGRVDLVQVEQLLAPLDDLPVAPLEAEIDRLRELDPTRLVGRLADARERVLGLGDRALGTVATARDLRTVLPGLLGGEGPRTYLLALQNAGELRGTGGFLGFSGTLTAIDGRLVVGPVTGYDVNDLLVGEPDEAVRPLDFEDRSRFDDPVERSEDLAARYDHVLVGSYVANSNVHPDLARSAPSMLALVERNAGVELDGIIALDPTALGLLQEAIGPLDVPDELAALAPGLPDPIPPARIPAVLMTDVYQELGGESPQRKAYHAAIAEVATRSVLSGDWDPGPFVRQFVLAAAERHVQVHSRDEVEQAALERLGVAGRLVPDAGRGDLLAVTANNAGGNKQDVLVGHELTAQVQLGRPDLAAGTVPATRQVQVALVNPLDPEGLDPYIAGLWGNRGTTQENFAQYELSADNRTWFSVWSPRGASFSDAVDGDGEPLTLAWGPVGDVVGFDHHLVTPSESTGSFSLQVSSTAPLEVRGDTAIYRLTLWRQAKGIPDLWDLTVAAPDGWRVDDAQVSGGGRGVGTGAHGGGVPLEVEVDESALRVRGTTTEDLVVEVRLVRT